MKKKKKKQRVNGEMLRAKRELNGKKKKERGKGRRVAFTDEKKIRTFARAAPHRERMILVPFPLYWA